jgi:hypothetical protein
MLTTSMHALSFQSAECFEHQWLIMLSLSDTLVIQEAPQPLFFGVLGGRERHGASDLAELGRDALGDADNDQRQSVELAIADSGQLAGQSCARAIIEW